MEIIKQLRKIFKSLILSNFEGEAESGQKSVITEKSLEQKKSEILEFIANDGILSLDDNPKLKQNIKEKLEQNQLSKEQINIIYKELNEINKIEKGYLKPDKIKEIKEKTSFDRIRKEFTTFRQMYNEHLKDHLKEVKEAEDAINFALGFSDYKNQIIEGSTHTSAYEFYNQSIKEQISTPKEQISTPKEQISTPKEQISTPKEQGLEQKPKETSQQILEKEILTTIESNPELKGYLSNPELKDSIISTIKGKITEDITEDINLLEGKELSKELREKIKENINKIVNDNKKEFAATKKFLENPNDIESQKKYVEEMVSANPAGYMDKISSQPQEFKSKNPIINFIFNLLKLFGFNLSGMGNDFSSLESFSNIGSGLGSLSEQFESGGKGPLAINFNDNGKSSFGTYQLRSEALATFAKENGISGFQDGVLNENSEFTKNWKAKVNEIGVEKFRELEHDFIQKTHFTPQLGKIKSVLPEVGKFSLSMQNVIWSVSVQHGANSDLITNVLSKGKYTPGDLQSESKLINDIYNARRTKYSNYSKRYNIEESIALSQLNAHTKSEGYIADGIKNGNWFSRPLEKNPRTGVTLCSKTAFLNLSDMGINTPRGASALESYKLSGLQQGYKDNGSSLNNLMQNSNNNVIDVYLDASSKNKEYGHRAVARREGEKWYIYDPYYSISGRDGVEAKDYIKYMNDKGRNFWQAKGYKGNV